MPSRVFQAFFSSFSNATTQLFSPVLTFPWCHCGSRGTPRIGGGGAPPAAGAPGGDLHRAHGPPTGTMFPFWLWPGVAKEPGKFISVLRLFFGHFQLQSQLPFLGVKCHRNLILFKLSEYLFVSRNQDSTGKLRKFYRSLMIEPRLGGLPAAQSRLLDSCPSFAHSLGFLTNVSTFIFSPLTSTLHSFSTDSSFRMILESIPSFLYIFLSFKNYNSRFAP